MRQELILASTMSRFLRQFLGASIAITALPAIDRRLTGELPTELGRLLKGEATLPDTDSSCSTVCVTTSHSINTQVPILWHVLLCLVMSCYVLLCLVMSCYVLFLLAAAASVPPHPPIHSTHTHFQERFPASWQSRSRFGMGSGRERGG